MQTATLACPQCGQPVEMAVWPDKYAGIWECASCDITGTCEHTETRTEMATVDYMRNGEPDQYEESVYVCAHCGVQLEGSPAADAAEDQADMAYDEMRDNEL